MVWPRHTKSLTGSRRASSAAGWTRHSTCSTSCRRAYRVRRSQRCTRSGKSTAAPPQTGSSIASSPFTRTNTPGRSSAWSRTVHSCWPSRTSPPRTGSTSARRMMLTSDSCQLRLLIRAGTHQILVGALSLGESQGRQLPTRARGSSYKTGLPTERASPAPLSRMDLPYPDQGSAGTGDTAPIMPVTNPIESTFATIRPRTRKTRTASVPGPGSASCIS